VSGCRLSSQIAKEKDVRRKPSEVRSLAFVSIETELFAILVIGYAFLLPMPTSYAILFALSASLFMTGADAIRSYFDFSRTQTLESVWINELTMRYAIDDVLASLADAQVPKVDWREKARAAIEDAQRADLELEWKTKWRTARSSVLWCTGSLCR
jgi:hypothetical protein